MPTEPPSLDPPPEARRDAPRRRPRLVTAVIAAALALIVAGWCWNSLRPENCYRRGRKALAAGDHQTVIRESRRLLAAPGFASQGRLLRGLLFIREGGLVEALNELQHAARDRETAVEALTSAAECYYLLGQHVQAIERARAAIQRDADALDARRWLASACYDLGATDQAVEQLKIVAEKAPHDSRPDRLLGLIYKDNEQFTDAVAHYREALRRDPGQPDRQSILTELAESLVKVGRFDEAQEVLQQCPRTAATLTLQAACDENLGRPQDARERLQAALALDSQSLAARLQLGPLLLIEGRPADAVAVLEEAVRAAPHSSQAHFLLSQAYAGQGERAKADDQMQRMRETKAVEREFTDLHEAAAANPADADLRYRIGSLARQLDKWELARLWFRAALAIDPTHAGARAALAEDRPAPP
jgi:tetratricopeptide (TPR) repeat protein